MKRCAFALERGFFFHLLRFLWQKATYSSAAAFINSVKVQWTQSYILCPVSLLKVQMTIQYWGVLKYQRQKMFFFSNAFSFFLTTSSTFLTQMKQKHTSSYFMPLHLLNLYARNFFLLFLSKKVYRSCRSDVTFPYVRKSFFSAVADQMW